MPAKFVRLGYVGYVELAYILKHQPMTIPDMGATGFINRSTAQRIMPAMHRLGWLHIAGYRQVIFRGKQQAIYAFGKGEDAPPPTQRSNGRPIQGGTATHLVPTRIPSDLLTFCHFLESLECPGSTAEHGKNVGMSEVSARQIVRRMKKLRMVHIALWVKQHSGGAPVPQMMLGHKRDAPRPKPLTKGEVNARYVEGRRAKDAQIATMFALVAANDQDRKAA